MMTLRWLAIYFNKFKNLLPEVNDFSVIQIAADDLENLDKIFRLRVTCRQEQGYITLEKYPNGWFDDSDFTAFHFAIFYRGQIIASSRLNIFDDIRFHPYFPAFAHLNKLPRSRPISYLSRIVVLPEYRKKGLSKSLVTERENFSAKNTVMNVFADVADFQIDNFKRYGYKSIGKLDITKIRWDVNPDHFLMHKEL